MQVEVAQKRLSERGSDRSESNTPSHGRSVARLAPPPPAHATPTAVATPPRSIGSSGRAAAEAYGQQYSRKNTPGRHA